MPFVLRLETKDYQYSQNEKLETPNPGTLAQLFLEYIKAQPNPHIALKGKDRKMQTELLVNWLNSLMKAEIDSEARLACYYLCCTFYEFLNTEAFNSHQTNAVDCFESALKWIPSYIESDRLYTLKFLRVKFYRDQLSQNYPDYLSQLKEICQFIFLDKNILKDSLAVAHLSELFLHVPNKASEKVLKQRSQAFISFITFAHLAFKEFNQSHFPQTSTLLTDLLAQGFDHKALDEKDSEAAKAFDSCLAWLSPKIESDPQCLLLKLEFYQKSLCLTNPALYCKELKNLMAPLKEHIVKTKNIRLSDRFFLLLSKLELSSNHKPSAGDLLADWIVLLRLPINPSHYWHQLCLHTSLLYEKAGNYPVFKSQLGSIKQILTQTSLLNLFHPIHQE